MAQQPKQPLIVVVGKSGAGKSVLCKTLLGTEGDNNTIDISPDSGTRNLLKGSLQNEDLEIHIVDTPGLKENEKEKMNQLKKLAEYTDARAYLLLYCIPIGPGSRFDDCNPITMKCLQEAYGKNIWQHCILVFTMSNLALEHIRHQQKNASDKIIVKYTGYIQTYAEKFKTELMLNLKVEDIDVVTIFNLPQHEHQPNTIVAIPAGLDPKDRVLPAGIPSSKSWRDVILEQLIQKYDPNCQLTLLKYQYWTKIAKIVKEPTLHAGLAGYAIGLLVPIIGLLLGTATLIVVVATIIWGKK